MKTRSSRACCSTSPGSLDYFVEAGGVRSATYRLNVVDMPYVQKLELEYHFPAYTGLEPRKIEDGGDIAVLRGTEIRVKVVPTMASKGGQVAINEQQPAALMVERRTARSPGGSSPTRTASTASSSTRRPASA